MAVPEKLMVEIPSLPFMAKVTIWPATVPEVIVALVRPHVAVENASEPVMGNCPCAFAVVA